MVPSLSTLSSVLPPRSRLNVCPASHEDDPPETAGSVKLLLAHSHPGARYQKVPTQTSVASVKIGSLTLYTFQCGLDMKTERHKLFSPKAISWDLDYRIHRFANLFSTLFPKCDVTKNWNPQKSAKQNLSQCLQFKSSPSKSIYDVI